MHITRGYELEERTVGTNQSDGRIGTIQAAYEGPDDTDTLEITVYPSEAEAERAWRSRRDALIAQSTKAPREEPYGRICAIGAQSVACAVRISEGIIVGTAGVFGERFDANIVEPNARSLLQAGVKHWVQSRGVEWPDSDR